MEWKKAAALGAVLAMSVSAIAGCGSSGQTTGTSAAATTAAASEAAEESSSAASGQTASAEDIGEPNGGDQVTLWHYFEGEADALNALVKQYNESQSDIYIVPTYVSREELMKQYTIGAVSGDLPDIGMCDAPDMASYISLGVFADIDSQLQEWGQLDQFYKGPLESCRGTDGHLYGLPNNSNCLALLCNMDMLKAAGIDPATFSATSGHIVLRVLPGGGSYYVYVLDDSDFNYRVKDIYGPFTAS